MPRHPADRGPSSWSRHGDARQLLSLQHPHARASSHLLWSGSDTEEEEEGRSNTLPRQLTGLLRAARKLLFGFTWSIQRPCPSCRSATKQIEPFGRTRTGALAHDIGYSRKLPLKSPNACHIASLGFLFANFRPPRRAGGLARGERGPGRGPLAGWGAYGRGGGEVQVAAALALVSACLAHRQVMRRMLGGSGSGVVGWGKWAPS